MTLIIKTSIVRGRSFITLTFGRFLLVYFQDHFTGDTVHFYHEEYNVCMSPFVVMLAVIDDHYLYPLTN